ncbi:MAG: flagellar biosynthesis anti-sigma factor FlgM [Deltaproteobacteria bacterium]|nr:flagellar biosynthesis anti-sigma factor FlgM [Deltaproteobacteria bacterium]
MKISDIFRSSSFERTERADESQVTRRSSEQNSAERGIRRSFGEDTVTISPMSRQLAQISRVMSEDETKSAQKVGELKDKIANGEYKVNSDLIANSFVNYLRETGEDQ